MIAQHHLPLAFALAITLGGPLVGALVGALGVLAGAFAYKIMRKADRESYKDERAADREAYKVRRAADQEYERGVEEGRRETLEVVMKDPGVHFKKEGDCVELHGQGCAGPGLARLTPTGSHPGPRGAGPGGKPGRRSA